MPNQPPSEEPHRIGVVGTGFIARGASEVIRLDPSLEITGYLTRRDPTTVEGFPTELLTREIDELLEHADLVFEASGDPVHATTVIERALSAGRRVVTMNSEFHVTTGSYFVGRGYLSEAEGDQPGALAVLYRDAVGMGFRPAALVNIKGFLNHTPTREDMEYWSKLQGLSLHETTSFTDGTKLQIEQAFVANGLGADIVQEGMLGGRIEELAATDYLVEHAQRMGVPVSDYVLCKGAPPGVFVVARHPVQERLPNYGPYEKLLTRDKSGYVLLRPYHLCALEVANSLRNVLGGQDILLDNGPVPRVSVAAVAKRELATDEVIERAIGGFDVRGVAVRTAERPDHVPVGLLDGARLTRAVEAGQPLTFDDVELRPSRAAEIWSELRDRAVAET
ncbi:MAG: SAF domain-containing protein [Sandaracinaceae bacterium]